MGIFGRAGISLGLSVTLAFSMMPSVALAQEGENAQTDREATADAAATAPAQETATPNATAVNADPDSGAGDSIAEATGESQNQETQNQVELKENSWRYQDGTLIVDGSEYASEGATALSAGQDWSWTENGYVNPNGEVITGALNKGIDVSEHQGQIDWNAVKADGIDFAIIRCGYGSDYTYQDDKWWNYNVSECERLGIPYGVYLYSYAKVSYGGEANAYSEAQHALRLLQGHHPTLPVFFDMEDNSTLIYNADGSLNLSATRSNFGEMAYVFCEAMENAGYWAGVYASKYWFETYLTDPIFENYMRWVAQYNNYIQGTEYQGYHVLWQCTSTGQVNGVQGNVDINFDYFGFGFPPDVKEHLWFVRNGSYTYATKQNLMSGYPNGYWGPDDTLTRGMVATILWRAAGKPQADSTNFSDVDYGAYYGAAIEWARSVGIIDGYGDTNTFGPEDPVTREQFAAFLCRYAARIAGANTYSDGSDLSAKVDSDTVSGWAWNSMAWAVDKGVVNGVPDENGVTWINPQGTATRAQAATMLASCLRDVL